MTDDYSDYKETTFKWTEEMLRWEFKMPQEFLNMSTNVIVSMIICLVFDVFNITNTLNNTTKFDFYRK